jgi:hypothetical protein
MVTFLYQALIDAEATQHIGAAFYERSLTRTTRRNGSRPRRVSSKAGDLSLKIPKIRKGSFFPSILERRRRIDEALYAVVIKAYVRGVSTRKVDDLVHALGVDDGISKSEVSRIYEAMDEELEAFRTRSLADTTYPYVFLDATYIKGRVYNRLVSRALVVEDVSGVNELNHDDVTNAHDIRDAIHKVNSLLSWQVVHSIP